MIRHLPLLAKGKPGGRAYYADINALSLGEICQQITGKTLFEFLENLICHPLYLIKRHYYKLTEESIAPIYNGDYISDWRKYLST